MFKIHTFEIPNKEWRVKPDNRHTVYRDEPAYRLYAFALARLGGWHLQRDYKINDTVYTMQVSMIVARSSYVARHRLKLNGNTVFEVGITDDPSNCGITHLHNLRIQGAHSYELLTEFLRRREFTAPVRAQCLTGLTKMADMEYHSVGLNHASIENDPSIFTATGPDDNKTVAYLRWVGEHAEELQGDIAVHEVESRFRNENSGNDIVQISMYLA